MSEPDAPNADGPLLDHLFRREAGRMLASLTRVFGIHNLSLAEDVVQDALCSALETWKFRGVPEHPGAWLMAAARRRAIDVLRHERVRRDHAPALRAESDAGAELERGVELSFAEHEVRDDQLRMMFSCCDPQLPDEAQTALILNVLCGFSVREVAAAFLDGEASTEKRLQRAKQALSRSGSLFEVSGAAPLRARLASVLRALYLLFNEGYHGAHPVHSTREELCEEATSLCAMLSEHPATSLPETRALLALMCLHAARLPARYAGGELQTFEAQDRSRWNKPLVARGLELLAASAEGDALSRYHLEAAIAAEHAAAPRAEDTRWDRIVHLYDLLVARDDSPMIALSRAIAVGMAQGPEHGLRALDRLENTERLMRTPFYDAALGELHAKRGDLVHAITHFERALGKARNDAETRFLGRRVEALRARATN